MTINVHKLEGVVTGAIAVGMVSFFAYFIYLVFFTGPVPETSPSLSSVNPGVFSSFPKMNKAAEVVTGAEDKFVFRKKGQPPLVQKKIYQSFTDDPVDVPLSEKRGRADPFVLPYATP